MSDKLYSILKWIAIIVLPAIQALFLGVSQLWGIPYSTEITQTIALIHVFVGTLLGISAIKYNSKDEEEWWQMLEVIISLAIGIVSTTISFLAYYSKKTSKFKKEIKEQAEIASNLSVIKNEMKEIKNDVVKIRTETSYLSVINEKITQHEKRIDVLEKNYNKIITGK